MKNRKIGLSLSALLMLALLVTSFACSKPAPAPAPTTTAPAPAPKTAAPSPTATPTPTTTAVKPFVLKMSTWHPVGFVQDKAVLEPWMAEVEKKSGGRIKFEFYTSEQLGKSGEHYNMLVNGIADVAQFNPVWTAGMFPLTSVSDLPLAGPKTGAGFSEALWKLYKLDLTKEYDKIHVISMSTTSPHHLNMAKKPIRTLADIKGLRIRTTGGGTGKAAELLGATSMTIVATEVYTSMQKGMFDGFFMAHAGLLGYKLEELMKYSTVIGVTAIPLGVGINKATYAKLPADLQKLLDETSEPMSRAFGQAYDDDDVKAKGIFNQRGIEVINLAPEEMQKAKDAVKPLWDDWAKQMEAKGLPGTKVMADWKKIVTEVK